MMDGKSIRKKLIGSDDERAVSPVIGVILMVAITVILAAVIAAFVLDMGSGVNQEAQAGVAMEHDASNDELQIEVTSLNNADFVVLGSAADDLDSNVYDSGVTPYGEKLEVGDTLTIDLSGPGDWDGSSAPSEGTITAIAVLEDNEVETRVGSVSWD